MMARKTTTTTIEEPEEKDELDVFERARLEFSGAPRVKLTIYRYDDGETSYLKRVDYTPETIDEEWIRKKWGPGSYQLRFLDSENPQARWSRVITIAADTPASAPAGSMLHGDSFLLETLRQQNMIMLQALIGKPGAAPSGNEAMVKLIEVMQSQNQTLLQANLNRPDMSSTLLTVFEKGLAIAADAKLESEGGWLSQIGRAARDLLPALQEMARMRVEPARVYPGGVTPTTPLNPPPPPMLPSGKPTNGEPSGFVATSPAPATPTTPGIGAEGILEQSIRSFAPDILQAIQQGATPADVADAILDAIPPRFYGEFKELSPELIVRVAPELGVNPQFVTELVESLRETTAEDHEPTPAA